jgi:uncharacterized UBP type Zn finger protein
MEALMAMGFDRGAAQKALRACGGDVDRAIDMIFNGGGAPMEQEDPVPTTAVSVKLEWGLFRYVEFELF